MTRTEIALPDLYLEDETAWLEAMADLIAKEAWSDLDYANLQEYLTDMAKRDRREVESRLAVLLMHVLKWSFQPERRTRSWKSTIIEQRFELGRLAGRGVLKNHGEVVIDEIYREAVERATVETGLSVEDFPEKCAYTFQELLSFDPKDE